ncbi:hypothetical protein QQM79_14730 [Marinobacteraceae bacterium S3BR75-40.1]
MLRTLITLILLAPAAVLAHPGDHSGGSAVDSVIHLLTEPDHLAMFFAGASVLAVILFRLRRPKAATKRVRKR